MSDFYDASGFYDKLCNQLITPTVYRDYVNITSVQSMM